MKLPRLSQVAFIASALVSAVALKATPVQVTELAVGAGETVWISSDPLGGGNDLHVFATLLKLDVDGTAMDAFCIDPWHWSGAGAMSYELVPLENAPKSANDTTPNPMGAAAAKQIAQLWQQYYNPSIDNVTAAALQIKIWQIVDAVVANGTFALVSVDGADSAAVYSAIASMENFLDSNPNAVAANLKAVTGAGGQDYVIAFATVPDSGVTVLLVGAAFAGLVALRRRW